MDIIYIIRRVLRYFFLRSSSVILKCQTPRNYLLTQYYVKLRLRFNWKIKRLISLNIFWKSWREKEDLIHRQTQVIYIFNSQHGQHKRKLGEFHELFEYLKCNWKKANNTWQKYQTNCMDCSVKKDFQNWNKLQMCACLV